jgi:hypothetical protein
VNKCVRVAVATLTIAIVAVGSTGRGVVGAAPKNGYEVWLVDQSNSNGKAHGGAIHICRRGTRAEQSPRRSVMLTAKRA